MEIDNSKKTLIRSIILGVAVILVGVFISNKLSSPKGPIKTNISFRESSIEVFSSFWDIYQVSLESSGRLRAANRFDVFAEVTGKLINNSFREGNKFGAGSNLLVIENEEFNAQLNASRSNFLGLLSQLLPDISIDYPDDCDAWNTYTSSISVESPLPDLPNVNNLKLKKFLSGRGLLNQYYQIKSQEIRQRKYNIKAPYQGVLTEATIQPGALVRAGQKVGVFVEPGIYELEASIPESQLPYLRTGQKVRLNSNYRDYWGKVVRMNQVVDAQTQMIKVYIQVKSKHLKEGQYMSIKIEGNKVDQSMRIPRKLINNGKLWVVSKADSTLYAQPIKIESIEAEYAIVSHMDTGLWLVNRPVSGAFSGMKITPQLMASKD